MDRDAVKKYLKQIRILDCKIDYMMEELKSYRILATKITRPIGNESVQSSAEQDKIGTLVAKIADKEKEIDEKIDKMVDLKNEISNMIYCLDDIDQRRVLILRYISFKKYAEIAVHMCVDIRTIFRLEEKALDNLKDVIECHKIPVL